MWGSKIQSFRTYSNLSCYTEEDICKHYGNQKAKIYTKHTKENEEEM